MDPIHTNKYVLPFEQPAENWPVYTRRPVCQKNTAKIMPLPARDSLTAMVLTRRREETGFIERIAAHAEYRVSGFRRSSETVFTVNGNCSHSHGEKPGLSRNFVGRTVCPGQFNRRRKPIAATMATRGFLRVGQRHDARSERPTKWHGQARQPRLDPGKSTRSPALVKIVWAHEPLISQQMPAEVSLTGLSVD